MRQTMHLLSLVLLFVVGTTSLALAQTSVQSARVPLTFLKQIAPRTGHPGSSFTMVGTKKNAGLASAAKSSSLPGVDSVANWSDQFTAPGFDFSGNPQSVWPYTMVGTPPESGRGTLINAPIVPVTVDLLGPDGQVAIYNGAPLTFSVTGDILQAVLNSPVFQPWIYTSGIGQFNDQMMRAQFADRIHSGHYGDNGWHVNLLPRVKTPRRMQIPFGSWYFATDANGAPAAALVEGNVFSSLLFPESIPVDSSTPIGAAEVAGDITTRDISTFLFNNVYLYDTTIDQCCVLGFHSYDFEPGDRRNGNRERRYVMNYSSWITNGLFLGGFEDITAFSHEMSETFNDPFVDNQTPWWLSSDPIFGSICQDNLESGDVIEVLSGNPVYPVSLQGHTYHPQNEALFSWFAFQSPSPAHLGAYSFPDETTLTTLSPGPLLPGCKAAQ
jgi:hypothetical protein